ncbi:DUF3164 family protein [Emcibacter sp.]|uniref:DUF3164 family protein n=1 Tax=Emcibacter sp. TaxID=1979954 RepID=UPI002AA91BEE|nr:DUF3164 family protein [Emcibacter sp.]
MNQIPEGYLKDSKGSLVPLKNIKQVDLLRNSLVKTLCEKAEDFSQELSKLKAEALAEMNAFVDLSAAEYSTSYGGQKGNLTLPSYCGKYKVMRAIADNITFDERLLVAKQLIDECITDWSADANDKIRILVQRAFQTNSQGHISTGRVLELRQLDIQDEKWQQAMQAIADSIHVQASTTYVRFYRRIGGTEQYEQIPLDIAKVRIPEAGHVQR